LNWERRDKETLILWFNTHIIATVNDQGDVFRFVYTPNDPREPLNSITIERACDAGDFIEALRSVSIELPYPPAMPFLDDAPELFDPHIEINQGQTNPREYTFNCWQNRNVLLRVSGEKDHMRLFLGLLTFFHVSFPPNIQVPQSKQRRLF
jgi:hypothetical protein